MLTVITCVLIKTWGNTICYLWKLCCLLIYSMRINHMFEKNFDNKDFLLAFSQDLMMYDLDYALLWRGSQTNSLFTIRSKRVKKRKKQFFYQHRPIFISGYKRLLFVWRWLSVLIRVCSARGVKRKYGLIPSVENFLMAPSHSQLLNAYKLHIYKIKLLRVM